MLSFFVPCKSCCIYFLLLAMLLHCKPKKNQTPEPKDSTPIETPFKEVPSPKDVVMYEVNLRAFSQGGDLNGVRARLDEIKKLGVNVIWLMPIHPIGQINSVNSPYSVKDFKAVSAEYGSLADLKLLVKEAHGKGMAVIMDWVANHTAWDNPWMANKSWYTQDAAGNVVWPAGTNWQDVADLNFSNQEMRLAMIEAMKYWINTANIDGYRCDHADGVPFAFWKQAIDSLYKIPNRKYILLAEGTRTDHYSAGFDLLYSWNFYSRLIEVFNGQSPQSLASTHQADYVGVPSGKHRLRYTTNHDQSAWDETPITYFKGKQGALAASVSAIFYGGSPLIYSGQEVGKASKTPFFTKSPIDWNQNPDVLLTYQKMLQFYRSSNVARAGALTNYAQPDFLCFVKKLGNQELLVIINFKNVAKELTLPNELRNTSWTNVLNQQNEALAVSLNLESYQFLILTRQI